MPAAAAAPAALNRAQRATLEALAETILPEGGALPGARSAKVADAFESYVAGCAPGTRRTLRLMLSAFDLSSIGTRHLRAFHRLPLRARVDYVEECERSSLRQRREALVALKALIVMFFCANSDVSSRIGYDGAPLKPLRERPAPKSLETESPSSSVSERVQVVIVGSGAGGAVMAKELAEAGLEVLVLEEGNRYDLRDFQGALPDRLRKLYRQNGLTFTFGRPVISLPMGMGVGGSTLVNSGTCFRAPHFVWQRWRESTGIAFDEDRLLPAFERVESMLNVAPSTTETLGPNAHLLEHGRVALGYRGGIIARNAKGCHGHGVCAFGCPIDAKLGMHVSYLPRAVAAGTRVMTGCRVTRILVERGRAVGVRGVVRTESGLRPLEVRAQHVVLAAGAIHTPALLLRNRLANSSGQVGRNLRIHPGCGVLGVFDDRLDGWRGVMQGAYVAERIEDGILLEATFPPPGIGYSAGALPGSGLELKHMLERYGYTSATGLIVSDQGAGRVRALPRGGALMNYNLASEDVHRVIDGIALAVEVQLAAGAREVHTLLPGLPPLTSMRDVQLVKEGRWRASDLKLSAYHPMGTCRMGRDPRRSVVDENGGCHDVENLSVVDASILPGSTYVNPQLTIMALATNAAYTLAARAAG